MCTYIYIYCEEENIHRVKYLQMVAKQNNLHRKYLCDVK